MNELIIETQDLDFSYSKSRKDIDALMSRPEIALQFLLGFKGIKSLNKPQFVERFSFYKFFF